jgi:magnesium transporter
VHDHFSRVTSLAEGSREVLSGLLEVYWSMQSSHMNEVMKTLTLISTIFMPITFIAGVYGMNFAHMPELSWLYGYPAALGAMALVAVGIVLYFRAKKWL